MDRPTPQELMEKKMSSLAAPVRDTLNSADTASIIEKIVEEYDLEESQAYILLDEVAYTLFGISTIEEFKENLIENLEIKEGKASSMAAEINSLIFAPIKKFLRSKKEVYLSVGRNESSTATAVESTKTVQQSEDLNHHDILNEIEAPTPSLKNAPAPLESTPNSSEESIKVMSKEARDLIKAQGSDEVNTTTTKAPTLQEAIGSMPDIGGFIPVNNVLAPSQKVAAGLDSKLTTPSATPMKEVFIPKKLDPYREPAE